MNILITGANGQLGRSIRRELIGLGAEAITTPVATLSLEDKQYLFSDITVSDASDHALDITDRDVVRAFVTTHRVGLVINCAAYTNVDAAESNAELCHLINATAVRHLAETMQEQNGFLIHVSTDYVFGGSFHNRPIAEEALAAPLGVYGESKLAGEQHILQSSCRHIILRTAWLYSEFGHNFVKTMQRLSRERDVLKVVVDQCGTPTYAGDLAEAIICIVREDLFDQQHQGIYHFSNEGVCSWYDFAHAIIGYGSNTCRVVPSLSEEYPSPVTRPSYSVLDKAKFKNTFGRTIPHWTESLARCLSPETLR